MTYWANWLTFLPQAEEIANRLDTKLTYKITVEPIEAREAAFRLWHSFRDVYSAALGPRDREECKQRLKFKTGPHRIFQRLMFDPEKLEHVMMVVPEWEIPKREGSFAVISDDQVTGDPMIVFLISINSWTVDELLDSINLIKFDLDENAVDYSRLGGGV